jgi:hypothetical protein
MAGKHAKEQRAWREAFLLNMQIMDGLPNQIGLAIQAADSVSPVPCSSHRYGGGRRGPQGNEAAEAPP